MPNESSPLVDASGLAALMRQFVADRDWAQFHTPKNLVLALVGEVGELAAEFQWLTEADLSELNVDPDGPVAQEIADVLIYLVQLADNLNIDLDQAVTKKMEHNAARYTVADSFGNAEKRP